MGRSLFSKSEKKVSFPSKLQISYNPHDDDSGGDNSQFNTRTLTLRYIYIYGTTGEGKTASLQFFHFYALLLLKL